MNERARLLLELADDELVVGGATPAFAELWNEMTSVRRSAPGAEW